MIKVFIKSLYLILLLLFECTAPIQITVSDSIKPYLNNTIDIVKIDTVRTSYGDGVMYKIHYRYTK
jgi:hypothetical protein